MIPYQVISVDLAVVNSLQTLIGPASGITSFTVLVYPAGNTSFLRLGQSGQPIPVVEGMTWEYDPCIGPERDGLYWVQPAAGAGVAQIAVFLGGGAVSIG